MQISPIIRRKAKDRGIDLTRIVGTGADGRITQADLQQADLETSLTLSGTADPDHTEE